MVLYNKTLVPVEDIVAIISQTLIRLTSPTNSLNPPHSQALQPHTFILMVEQVHSHLGPLCSTVMFEQVEDALPGFKTQALVQPQWKAN